MNVTLAKMNAFGHIHVNSALGAFINLGSAGSKGAAVAALHTEHSAAVQAAVFYPDIIAVLEEKHPAGAGTGFFGVACGKAGEADIAA